MMGTEDMGERRQVNHTPAIALGAAAFLLLLVGALSYRDFVKTSYEKEYAEKERELMMRHGYVPYPAGQNLTYNQAPAPGTQNAGVPTPGANAQVTPGAVAGQNPQNRVGFQGATNQNPVAPDPNQVAAANAIETSLPAPSDPELQSIRNSLDQVRQQSQRTEEQYQKITGEVNRVALDSEKKASTELSQEGIGDLSEELPEFLREATANPPGGNPSVQERLSRVREQVLREPSIAQVTNYNKEWGVVTFNAGSTQNVRKNQRFAIRRGGDILGWIKVDQVEANQSIGIMVTKNAESDTAIKPDVGDDLINFELF